MCTEPNEFEVIQKLCLHDPVYLADVVASALLGAFGIERDPFGPNPNSMSGLYVLTPDEKLVAQIAHEFADKIEPLLRERDRVTW